MRCPTLAELPPPPSGRTGWPWTIETPQLPPARPDGSPWPRISIVTPSYNQGQFVEETIRSILLQGYRDLEYIIIDGASTDQSVEIIRKYEPWLTYWVSASDDGQVAAINTGLKKATGHLLNWVNSDDLLLAHALEALGNISALAKPSALISGARRLRCATSGIETVQMPWPTGWPLYLAGFPDFPQDSTFFTRSVWEECGPLDLRLNYIFDVAFYASAMRKAHQILLSSFPFSIMQIHSGQKTTKPDEAKQVEGIILQKEYIIMRPTQKIINRLLRTRIGTDIQSLLALVNRQEAKKYKIVQYDYSSEQWKLSPLR